MWSPEMALEQNSIVFWAVGGVIVVLGVLAFIVVARKKRGKV
jgi:cytochrome c-type biogenesis protein CcmH/NrfF